MRTNLGWALLSGILIFASQAALPVMSQPLPRWQQPAPDNTKTNQDRSAPSADQQKANAADRETTRNIRKSIMADKGLSTYAHNIKVITQNGKVTLRGPVHSVAEKETVESKATAVAGKDNVTSYIDVVAK